VGQQLHVAVIYILSSPLPQLCPRGPPWIRAMGASGKSVGHCAMKSVKALPNEATAERGGRANKSEAHIR
jgi:hypothetical protein